MRGMVLRQPRTPLELAELPVPQPGSGQLQIRVAACAVCRTDLHVVDGELTRPKLPLIPGHEIVGRVMAVGAGVSRFAIGDRVGVPWLAWTCGRCAFCTNGSENLCDEARFTGYTVDGGYADFVVADHRFCLAIPDAYSDAEAAPLLCAGLIGYRTYAKAPDAKRLGIYGFGAAAHIVTQLARYQGREVYAFTRAGDDTAQAFARRLGAIWVGDSDAAPPVPLDAALIFAPAGELVPRALRTVRKGGTVVCGGIHMSDIPGFPYADLWGERSIVSVANLTRADGAEFLALAAEVGVRTQTRAFPLEQANAALDLLRAGRIEGAAVLVPSFDGH